MSNLGESSYNQPYAYSLEIRALHPDSPIVLGSEWREENFYGKRYATCESGKRKDEPEMLQIRETLIRSLKLFPDGPARIFIK